MKIPKWLFFVLIGGFVLIVVVGITALTKKSSPTTYTQKTATENTPSPTPQYSDWTYFKNGYGIKVPLDWKNTSDIGGTAVLEPGRKVGNITKVSITLLLDSKATGQRFTTQKEFDQWYATKGEVQEKIQKIDNVLLDGEKAVMLKDSSAASGWSIIVWARKDNSNVYITVRGDGKYSAEDEEAVSFMISSFKFSAPPGGDK